MRTVVLYQLLTLDGVAEEPGDWMSDDGREVFANLTSVIERQDTILLGRATYDEWSGYWPHQGAEPFRTFINGTPKHLFTSRPVAPDWSATEIVDRPAEEHVRELREQDGGDIGVHGSITLARSLVRAGLVDEYRFVVPAVLAGHGRRLFDGRDALRSLALADVARTPAGTLLLHYRRNPRG